MVSNSPHCGLCAQRACLHRQHRANNLVLVIVGHSGAEESRRKAEEHGFKIGEAGMIARNVATGTYEILVLAREG